jgi:meso-butanediol dehydrogenase / (S,S)-butanediol dehydrogenase / diacetyl reductase
VGPWLPGRFDGAAALVTGGAHGIGRACAVRLADEGARVAVMDIDEGATRGVVAHLAQIGGGPHLAMQMDVTDPSSVEQATRRSAGEFGQIDTLVNVAGGDIEHGTFEHSSDEVWTRMLELNLLGVVRCCRSAIPYLRRSTMSPAIVTVTSINAFTALGSEPYSAAKAGLTSLTTNLAAGLAHDGIRVNAVAPGTIRTRVWVDQEGGADRLEQLYPLGRVGEPEDVAGAVAFLASTDAAWITGHTLPVDGGLLTGGSGRMERR